ncbi:signal peptidase II [Candidatus Similichlamydia epinepheli]|uniref:signal peptidase II n=1 Tax=Candidatus Similichlamydia epinepheli TaxID=1903953 RepID=UPI000D3BA64D
MLGVRFSFFLNSGCAFGWFGSYPNSLFFCRCVSLICFFQFVKRESSPCKRALAHLAFVGGCSNLIDSLLLGGVWDNWEISFGSFVLNLNESDLLLSAFFIFSFLSVFRFRKVGV